jgi:arylsulfatase A-like enzyme
MLPVLRDPSLAGREHVFSERNWHNCDEHQRAVRSDRYKLIRNAYVDLPLGNPSDVSSSLSWNSLLNLKGAGKLTPEQLALFRAPRPRIELYDVEEDPWEFHNLADDAAHASLRAELEELLDRWIADTGDFPSTRRRRADNTDRVSGAKLSDEIAPQVDVSSE